jgi:NAD(P)-dependent dehydrogenase (short-subunit alcohol dehydrogenase family)
MTSVLITGTSKGIGYDAALQLARAGYDVIATMRNPDGSDLGAAAEAESLPVTIRQLDVDDDLSVAEVFSEFCDIDILVNNAGILSCEAIEDESLEKFRAVMETNFFGAVKCCKAVVPAMRKRASGCIINITSVAGIAAFAPDAAYSASKFALEAFTEILAQEVNAFGVRVALVEPGIIATPMTTTALPAYRSDTIYPQGRRIHAIFKNAAKEEAPPNLVSNKIQYIIESGTKRLRHPVGPDSLIFLGWRAASTDEHLIDVMGSADDSDFIEKIDRDLGIDLSEFL